MRGDGDRGVGDVVLDIRQKPSACFVRAVQTDSGEVVDRWCSVARSELGFLNDDDVDVVGGRHVLEFFRFVCDSVGIKLKYVERV